MQEINKNEIVYSYVINIILPTDKLRPKLSEIIQRFK